MDDDIPQDPTLARLGAALGLSSVFQEMKFTDTLRYHINNHRKHRQHYGNDILPQKIAYTCYLSSSE